MVIIWSAIGAEQDWLGREGLYIRYEQRRIDGDKIDVLLILEVSVEAEMALYNMPRVRESWKTVNVLYVLMFAASAGSGLVRRSKEQEPPGLVAMNKEWESSSVTRPTRFSNYAKCGLTTW